MLGDTKTFYQKHILSKPLGYFVIFPISDNIATFLGEGDFSTSPGRATFRIYMVGSWDKSGSWESIRVLNFDFFLIAVLETNTRSQQMPLAIFDAPILKKTMETNLWLHYFMAKT